LARRNPRCAGFVHAKRTARITSAILASEAASQRHSSSNISYGNAATSAVRFEQGDEKKERLSVTEYRAMKGCAPVTTLRATPGNPRRWHQNDSASTHPAAEYV
jgi:hypothetical protein